MRHTQRGRFLTFEGGDGSGKSTLARALCSYLKEKGLDVHLTREPGGTKFAEKIREVFLNEGHICSARTELLLVLAARNDHVEKVLEPVLRRGGILVCDRFIDSTVVYQGYAAQEDPRAVEQLATHAVPLIPDCTFLIDLPVSVSMKRRSGRGASMHDMMEKRDHAFHELVRSGFLSQAKEHPERVHVLDGQESVETLLQQVLSILKV